MVDCRVGLQHLALAGSHQTTAGQVRDALTPTALQEKMRLIQPEAAMQLSQRLKSELVQITLSDLATLRLYRGWNEHNRISGTAAGICA